MEQNKDRFFIPKKIHVGYVNRESLIDKLKTNKMISE